MDAHVPSGSTIHSAHFSLELTQRSLRARVVIVSFKYLYAADQYDDPEDQDDDPEEEAALAEVDRQDQAGHQGVFENELEFPQLAVLQFLK